MSLCGSSVSIKQGTDAWKLARTGKITASRIKDVLAFTKSGSESASRRDYRMQIVCEWLTGVPQDDVYQNEAMTWGINHEEEARECYMANTGFQVLTTGLVDHLSMESCAASPDGLVLPGQFELEPEGLLEIKCPKTATHIGWLEAGVVPPEHVPQMTWQLACCPWAGWNDFFSYDPRLPKNIQKFMVRLERDDAAIKSLEVDVAKFLHECVELKKKIEALG